MNDSEINIDDEQENYPETIAAIDLGSNSFHMVVARVDEHGNFSMIDQIKEMVRLRGGLDANNNMDDVVAQKALDCLQRFGDRIRHLPHEAVRAAGTNTLRTMKGSAAFLRKANKALGHQIEIIPGHEEARLVYLGVSHTLSDDQGKQLVIDIGGGSTEFIIGKKFEPKILESLNIGSVSVTKRFFPDGSLSADKWQSADTALRLEIMPIQRAYSSNNWKRATGSSGSIKATRAIIMELGLSQFGITLKNLYELRDRLIAIGTIDQLELPGLKEERAPVYAGGLAILIAIFESLKIESMTVSDGALREGLLYDMLGRIKHEDVRYRSVQDLIQRFNIDVTHADKVKNTALHCFKQVRKDWGIRKKRKLTLSWAADLHELGLSITHDKHHLQGSHIIEHADIPGFARRRQHWLAVLVNTHRKKLTPEVYETLHEDEREEIRYLSILLRIAVLFHRSRLDEEILPEVEASSDSLHLHLPDNMKNNALLNADLLQEKTWLNKIGFKLYY
jgi:exopolyphosphatase/guanosine-5'-triphosphate,3'-diphosphate pyrophosphatase